MPAGHLRQLLLAVMARSPLLLLHPHQPPELLHPLQRHQPLKDQLLLR